MRNILESETFQWGQKANWETNEPGREQSASHYPSGQKSTGASFVSIKLRRVLFLVLNRGLRGRRACSQETQSDFWKEKRKKK